MEEVKAFIFDLDGVITDTSKYHYLAWKRLANDLGMDFDREFNECLKGVSRMESLERILIYCKRDKDYTMDAKIRLADRKNEIYKEMIKGVSKGNLFDGIEEMLFKLRKLNIWIAIASVSRNAPYIIQRLGIKEYIDYVVDMDDIKRGKPNPDIFLRASHEFGLKSYECIGIEDAKAGIQAIKAAGMFSVGVGAPNKMIDADIRFDSPEKMEFEMIIKEYRKWRRYCKNNI